MDVEEFHRRYIEPAVGDILEGYIELEWTVSEDSGRSFEGQGYRRMFFPWKATVFLLWQL